MDINFKLLRSFVLVAEHANFKQASDQVHRSQSAVSAQIKQLEQQVGVELLHRTTRRVQLTAAGELLLTAARRGMQEVEHGLRQIQETVDLRTGRVALASSPIFAATRLAPILAAFEGHYPLVRVSVQELTPAELYACVERAEVDFGIGPELPASALDFTPMLVEQAFAMVSSKLWPAAQEHIALADLARLPLLLQSNTTALRMLLDEAALRDGIVLSPKYECTQAQTLMAMAAAGLGAAVLPAAVMPRRPQRAVRVLPIVAPVVSRRIGLVTARGRTLAPAAARLAELVRRSVRDAAADGAPPPRKTAQRAPSAAGATGAARTTRAKPAAGPRAAPRKARG